MSESEELKAERDALRAEVERLKAKLDLRDSALRSLDATPPANGESLWLRVLRHSGMAPTEEEITFDAALPQE